MQSESSEYETLPKSVEVDWWDTVVQIKCPWDGEELVLDGQDEATKCPKCLRKYMLSCIIYLQLKDGKWQRIS